jgi:hypothetical protein
MLEGIEGAANISDMMVDMLKVSAGSVISVRWQVGGWCVRWRRCTE